MLSTDPAAGEKISDTVTLTVGTTNDAMSVWFVGYTPDMAGVSYIAVDNMYYKKMMKK